MDKCSTTFSKCWLTHVLKVVGTFIKVDPFGSSTENDATGGAHLFRPIRDFCLCYMTHARDPNQLSLGIIEEGMKESWERNHGRGIMEKELGKETWGAIWRHMEPSGAIWTSGAHLGGNWRHLGGSWGLSWDSRGVLEGK